MFIIIYQIEERTVDQSPDDSDTDIVKRLFYADDGAGGGTLDQVLRCPYARARACAFYHMRVSTPSTRACVYLKYYAGGTRSKT